MRWIAFRSDSRSQIVIRGNAHYQRPVLRLLCKGIEQRTRVVLACRSYLTDRSLPIYFDGPLQAVEQIMRSFIGIISHTGFQLPPTGQIPIAAFTDHVTPQNTQLGLGIQGI